MMQIVYFSQKGQFLAEIQQQSGEKTFITPSPAKADGLRQLLIENASSDVVTIAKFTGDLMQSLWADEGLPAVKRKSELLLIFGILKTKYFPELGFEQFNQAYNLFSDLRSFTLNEDALLTVLEEQSVDIKKAVQLFWKLLDATGFLDEHGAYQKLAEALRSTDEKKDLKKTYIFWGFQHLNGQQVDLIKALSIRYDVIIPFPLALKEKLKKTDWLSWMRESKVSERDLALIPQAPKASWLKINSREISKYLKSILKTDDQVVLGVSKLSPLHLDIIPSRLVSYKIPHQLIQAELTELGYELKLMLKELSTLIDLEKFLVNKKLEWIKQKNVSTSFKYLKAIELYLQNIETIKSLTDEAVKIDQFFLKLLNEVVMLDQPRTSFIPISQDQLTIDLKDMSSLEDVKRNKRVLFCIDERFDEIQSLGQNYTEVIQKALANLGPLKRNELELLFKQWEFQDLFSQGEMIVLMADSTLKHSLIWKRLFSQIALKDMTISIPSQEKKVVDQFHSGSKKTYSGTYSASKFQAFLDCPRKFYFNYVDKIFPSVALENDLDSLKSGTISHKIIEVFYKRNLNLKALPDLTKEIMGELIKQEGLTLSQDRLLKHELIFNHRALNGITFLKSIEDILGESISWAMEEDFSLTDTYKIKGKIDCTGTLKEISFLLDFKSTKFSASSSKEVEQFESLQLWVYAKAAASQIDNFASRSIVMGYITLDKPSESNLLFSDQDLFEKFKNAKICKQYLFKDSFPDLLKSAEQKMLALTQTIQDETVFPARPRKLDVCTFCELNKVCIRSEIALE
jgi:hypothetical protein